MLACDIDAVKAHFDFVKSIGHGYSGIICNTPEEMQIVYDVLLYAGYQKIRHPEFDEIYQSNPVVYLDDDYIRFAEFADEDSSDIDDITFDEFSQKISLITDEIVPVEISVQSFEALI